MAYNGCATYPSYMMVHISCIICATLCYIKYNIYICVQHVCLLQSARILDMGWLRLVGSFKLQVSFAEYSFFYRALLQKRPINSRSLIIVATPQLARFAVCRITYNKYVHNTCIFLLSARFQVKMTCIRIQVKICAKAAGSDQIPYIPTNRFDSKSQTHKKGCNVFIGGPKFMRFLVRSFFLCILSLSVGRCYTDQSTGLLNQGSFAKQPHFYRALFHQRPI